MIKGLSAHTEEPNIEHMAVTCEQVEGSGDIFVVHIFREELSTEDQTTYDNAVALVGDNYENEILNTTSFMEISRMTSTPLLEGKDTKDFLTDYTESQKDDLRAFLTMVISMRE